MANKDQFTLKYNQDLENFLKKRHPGMVDYRIISESLDARLANKGRPPKKHYMIEYILEGDSFEESIEKFEKIGPLKDKPIIIGAGPAGLFAAIRFSEYGISTQIFERGESAKKRMLKIARFWRYGELDQDTNVCYGEGGAGLYSDGKLITRVKSSFIKYVMEKLVSFGAPSEVAYTSNPHLGSNKIREIITKISDRLKSQGHIFHYNSRFEKLIIKSGKVIGIKLSDGREFYSRHIILATGHSAGEIYQHLADEKVALKAKDFAIGVRIEHPRNYLDTLQYGQYADELGAARYRLANHNKSVDRGCYSFCMCPGGHVLSSGTETDGIVVNGMSNFARNSAWSNSALVVSIKAGEDFLDDPYKLDGLNYQRKVENDAYLASKEQASGKELPCMDVSEFLDKQISTNKTPYTSSPSGIFKANLWEILPPIVAEELAESLEIFEKKLPGFKSEKALLIAPETRTSAPVTIIRDKESLESTSHSGLYPCGEGAGYAGGITSAAVDGIKVVESIVKSLNS